MTPIPMPPIEGQRHIADYLDREVGKIDAMIAKTDALAELLESRAGSVIERNTVGRPGTSTRMKFCGDVALGKTFQGERRSRGETLVNYVRAASIQPKGLALDDQRMLMSATDLDTHDLKKGDVLVVEGGGGFGRSVVLDTDMPGWGYQNHVIRIRPYRNQDGGFLNYCVKGHYFAGLINVLADGATIPGLSSEKVRNLPIPELTVDEQCYVADRLDETTGEINAVASKLAELRTLLVERRSALISDVVSGRKKVA